MGIDIMIKPSHMLSSSNIKHNPYNLFPNTLTLIFQDNSNRAMTCVKLSTDVECTHYITACRYNAVTYSMVYITALTELGYKSQFQTMKDDFYWSHFSRTARTVLCNSLSWVLCVRDRWPWDINISLKYLQGLCVDFFVLLLLSILHLLSELP